jgi:hypothetical protein
VTIDETRTRVRELVAAGKGYRLIQRVEDLTPETLWGCGVLSVSQPTLFGKLNR